MSRLFEYRDRFLDYFADRGTIEVAGWCKTTLARYQAQGREPVLEAFFHADHFTISSRRQRTWTESKPEIALFLALSFAARPERAAIVHFSGWSRMAINDPACIDTAAVEIISAVNDEQHARMLSIISDFQSNHGKLALARRLEPLLDEEQTHG